MYDQNGNLIQSADEDGHVAECARDVRNLAEAIAYSNGRTVEFACNAAGGLAQMTDWLGEMSFTPDLLGRIQEAADHNNNTVAYEYDALGNRTLASCPDNTAAGFAYDPAGRLVSAEDFQEGATSYEYETGGKADQDLKDRRKREELGAGRRRAACGGL
jgi:YD repeat-containing protein